MKAPRIGIDLGTSHIVVFVEGKGILMSEPSIVARDLMTGTLSAIGNEAVTLSEQAPGKYVISHPFKNGTISDYETTVEIIKYYIKKVVRFTIQKPYLLLGATNGLTKIEKNALIEAAQQAGVQQTFFLDVPLAAAIGAEIPMDVPAGTLIVDIGGGTTTVAIFSFGRVITSRSVKIGGQHMDEAIVHYLRKHRSIVISAKQAEKMKLHIGSAMRKASDHGLPMEVSGKEVPSGAFKQVMIGEEEIAAVLQDVLENLIQVIKAVLEDAAPQVAADLISEGIVLTGGGALLRNLDVFLSKKLQVPVQIAEDTELCVAQGLGESLKYISVWKKEHDQQMRRS